MCICQELNQHLQLSEQRGSLQQNVQQWHLNHTSQSVDSEGSEREISFYLVHRIIYPWIHFTYSLFYLVFVVFYADSLEHILLCSPSHITVPTYFPAGSMEFYLNLDITIKKTEYHNPKYVTQISSFFSNNSPTQRLNKSTSFPTWTVIWSDTPLPVFICPSSPLFPPGGKGEGQIEQSASGNEVYGWHRIERGQTQTAKRPLDGWNIKSSLSWSSITAGSLQDLGAFPLGREAGAGHRGGPLAERLKAKFHERAGSPQKQSQVRGEKSGDG